jgi:tRNA(fMet)-specific endonuclease VapC
MDLLSEHQDRIAIPAPVWHERWFGCLRLPASRRRDAIHAYLLEAVYPSFPILPYDEPAARWHADERAVLEAAGRTPPYVDGQIAAVAAAHRLTLVTRNVADFEPFRGLEVVSWHREPAPAP